MRDRLIIVLLGVSLGLGAKTIVARFQASEPTRPIQEAPENPENERPTSADCNEASTAMIDP